MSTLIKELVDEATLRILTSNSDPAMINDEQVMAASKKLMKAIKLIELYPEYQAILPEFDILRQQNSVYAHRTNDIWPIAQVIFQLISLNLPDTDFREANGIKSQIVINTMLLDDQCDLGGDEAIFGQCVLALSGNILADETELLYRLLSSTASSFHRRMEQAPNYLLLKPMLDDAYEKWLYSFKYSLLIQKEPFRLEQTWKMHLQEIAPSNAICVAGLIDLLFVPNLSEKQIAKMVDVFLRTEKMMQVLNWVASLKRELIQRDFTNGAFSMALENGWIKWNELMNGSTEEIEQKIQDFSVEDRLWDEWKRLRVESIQIIEELQLSTLNGYVENFSAVTYMLQAATKLA